MKVRSETFYNCYVVLRLNNWLTLICKIIFIVVEGMMNYQFLYKRNAEPIKDPEWIEVAEKPNNRP